MNRAVSSPFLAVWLVRGAWTPLVCIAAPREFYNFIERKGVGVPRIASRRGTIKRDNHRRLFSRNELMNRAERRICSLLCGRFGKEESDRYDPYELKPLLSTNLRDGWEYNGKKLTHTVW